MQKECQIHQLDKAIKEIIDILRQSNNITTRKLNGIKKNVAKKYHLCRWPRNYEILSKMTPELRERFGNYILNKPVRSISGVSVVAVMTKPLPCPGRCIYCPGGTPPTLDMATPKSYTGLEPAARRARQLDYDPYKQVLFRIKQLEKIGHKPSKIEVIIMGGTFLATPKHYKDFFIRGIYEGLLGRRYRSLEIDDLQKLLETTKYRLVGLTIETRPDFCYETHVDEMLKYGTTRVEIGVQTLDESVLEFIQRGHDVNAIRKAFRIARDSALKICAHMMLNLPGMTPEKDIKIFEQLFKDPNFRPDMLKIYPTAIIKGTKLYELWKNGEYKPYSEETLLNVIANIKKKIPPWVRIQRVQRDIPINIVEGGYKSGNIRQKVKALMKKKGWKCRCIRCREVGHVFAKEGKLPEERNIRLVTRKYKASGGEEIFLSFEDTKLDILIGFLRLRKPSDNAHRSEIDSNTMLIRELHVYGIQVPIGERHLNGWQHRGYGLKLLHEAERIAEEDYDAKRIIIISGIGVREYYRRFGYRLLGPYMFKKLG
ncbi:MAG: tRNA uridine(34) 5-carboxymethylaminomethyl modification radical SAM/GNAT enzyme Elp3 [Candidatus Njordarchaeia archaeon]|nr:tRNA uridine(34) 5-carboxymethylaminomethyl modification radical SAM/GNAT enzyme Elp3 [Candidatus Korarchaeota archaeon]